MTKQIDNKSTRREWLQKGLIYGAVGTASAALAGIFIDVWFSASRFTTARWVNIAPASTIPYDMTVPFPDKKIAIVRKNSRLAAVSLECTHLGCLVTATGQGFYCPCHGSFFGSQGEVYSGPATRSLPWYTVRIHKNNIWIHTGSKQQTPFWVTIG